MFEIEFYKIIIWAIFLLSGYEAFSVKGLLNALLPIQSVSTGFISCYLLFFLCIPFLNILIHSMNEKQHIRLLLLLSFIYIFIGSIPKINVTMNYVSWFIVIYFIGSYIRLYERDLFNRTKLWGVLSLIFVIASLVSVVALSWIGSKFGYSGLHYFFLADSNKILAVVLSVSAFLFFKNIKIKQSKIINIVAGSTFGVLLIHANSETMRSWLWKDTLGNVGMYSSMWMPIHAIGSVVAIFTVCTAIDILRVNFIEKPFFILWDKVFPKVSNWFCDKEDVLLNKLKIQK